MKRGVDQGNVGPVISDHSDLSGHRGLTRASMVIITAGQARKDNYKSKG